MENKIKKLITEINSKHLISKKEQTANTNVKLGVFDKNFNIIGFKVDTFWSLSMKNFKTHTFMNVEKLISNFLYDMRGESKYYSSCDGKTTTSKYDYSKFDMNVVLNYIVVFSLENNNILAVYEIKPYMKNSKMIKTLCCEKSKMNLVELNSKLF